MAASSATPPTSTATTSSRCSRRCAGRRSEQLAHFLEAIVRNRDREHVLLDQPAAAVAHQHAATPGRAEIRRLEILLEPGEVAADGDPPADAAERPRFSLREVRVRVGPERLDVPSLGAVGAE